ncbi:MAG TPA: DUF4202 family protein [Enhygromyxa sp.]|nr:DUF4202 family protein [Enhygromyxa sp.]
MALRVDRVILRASPPAAVTERFELVAREFPFVGIHMPSDCDAAISVVVDSWRDPGFDFWAFDRALDRAAETKVLTIAIVGVAAQLPATALEVLTRGQRVLRRFNRESSTALFEAVLEAHRALHDLSLPLVRADFDHAIDVWQWLLRLVPRASLALQLAALFHDVERLLSESRQRIEQHAIDYQAFKDRHAARGAELAATVLRRVGVPDAVVGDVARLIATHERPLADDEQVAALNDADALSFFSLNSAGFAEYFGTEHTDQKIRYSLARLRLPARRWLKHVRLRADVRALIVAALE